MVRNYFDYISSPYAYQKKVDGKKKPDFIIPSVDFYYKEKRNEDDAILLSLKTTLKERWQQILNEGKRVRTRYLATLDKAVTSDQVSEMEQKNIILIVPEWVKANTDSYKSASNVITLKEFSHELSSRQKNTWYL